jgi:hypothetical protein
LFPLGLNPAVSLPAIIKNFSCIPRRFVLRFVIAGEPAEKPGCGLAGENLQRFGGNYAKGFRIGI